MHVALTDVLTCPRCGPGHGLILVPDEVRDRRVVSGFLGCPDCRERYGIRDGVADLSAPLEEGAREPEDREDGGSDRLAPEGSEGAVRLAGLLGLAGVQGVVLLAGPVAAEARALTELLEGVEVAATVSSSGPGWSGIRVGRTLPFQSGKLRGVALSGWAADRLLEEAARTVSPVGRLLLEGAPADARERLQAAGLRVLAEESDVVIAGRQA